MQMVLERMKIENFKAVRELEINFNSKKTNISGSNGAGKTTIADAFSWVLWNKNSHGDAPGSDNFHEKPLDENGNEVHNLETSVSLDCLLDGQRFDLKRTQSENWVKKRGSAEATFQGNVSTYWINGVETKLADFKARIAAIANEEVFRLIGSLSAFNAMEWKKRRAQLLSLSGADVDGELLSRPEYRQIADEVGQRNVTPDELRKILTDQRRRINDELKMLPVRIDEAKRSLPELTAQQIKDAEYMLADSKKDIAVVQETIASLKAGGDGVVSRQQVLALQQELVSLKRRLWDEMYAGAKKVKAEADEATARLKTLTDQLNRGRVYAQTYEEKVRRASAKVAELREKFVQARAEKVEVGSTICPTCGQEMPAEMIESIRAKAEAARKERMEDIRRRGIEAAADEKDARDALDEQSRLNDDLVEQIEVAQETRATLMQTVNDLPTDPDFTKNERYNELVSELEAAQAAQVGESDEQIIQYQKRLEQLQAQADKAAAVLAVKASGAETEARIKALEAQQQEAGARLSETENLIILLERFVIDRCGALEESINSRFPSLRWKLFDRQINGAIVDCCECLIPCGDSLVSYSSANTASQINADIEIVNVLSEYYDIEVPLFVDNSERVNCLADTDTQVITLAVSADDGLKIE